MKRNKKFNDPTMDTDDFSEELIDASFLDSENDSTPSNTDDGLNIFEEDETYDGFETSFNDNAQVQKIWLDADPYINQIFLSITNQEVRKKKIVKDGEDVYKQEVMQIEGTEPLANKLGVAQIMSIVRGMFNKEIVQGNIDRPQYDEFMFHFSINLMRNLIANRQRWEVLLEDTQIIHDLIVNGAHFYLTRTIGDGERRSGRNRQENKDDGRPKNFFEKIASNYKNKRQQVY